MLASVWFLRGLGQTVVAQEPTAEQLKFFETSIRPVLAEQCQKCHSAEKQRGNLRLDSRRAMLQGGDSGAAIVPGQPENSLLIRAIRQLDKDLKMPPKGKLSDKQIADFTQWVKQGAPYPEPISSLKVRHRDPSHWAFQTPVDPPVPSVRDTVWSRTSLDRFILAKLESASIAPAATADKRTLIRRATFDLTGLPPTPAEIVEFLADDSADAFPRLIDRLLASPAYGERWGRHWLDVARYADSNGLDENVAHGNAWRYRDYVVAAFNSDQPYDQFLVEQLAGDLLPASDNATRHRHLIATGFLAIGPKVLAEVDETKMQMDIVDEQIDTVGRAVLGLTFGCARCHDHKFDPVDTADYYGLAGIFKSTRTMETFKKVARWHENPIPTPEGIAAKAVHDEQVSQKKAAIQKVIDRADTAAKAAVPAGEKPPQKLEALYPEETRAELKRLRDELAQFEKSAPEQPSAMGVSDDAVVDVAVHVRGNPFKLGDVVPRRLPRVLAGSSPPPFDAQHSGRLELARSFVERRHPLTSRVMVNRVWRWHFGRGLVRTPDNFGLLGEAPTHPELLDWLAHRFMEQGWSLKKLHRLIMLSSTYQLSSTVDATAVERDPENRLFGRANVQRLEAEAVRDAMLAVSGQLDRTLGGSLLTVKNRAYFFDHTSKDLTDYSSRRRSIYLPVVRNNLYDVFQLLDYPDAAVPSGDRTTTTVAPQALMMMNSEFVARASADMAARILGDPQVDDAHRIQTVYGLAYGREATADEMTQASTFVIEVEKALQSEQPDAPQRLRQAWDSLCQVILAANEFIYLK
ncbi:MAG: PSD1 domain-containing protein [Planctomycetales bacterium]|nr:PSD1 domain-containing protein [Planctomycetales bacterium]